MSEKQALYNLTHNERSSLPKSVLVHYHERNTLVRSLQIDVLGEQGEPFHRSRPLRSKIFSIDHQPEHSFSAQFIQRLTHSVPELSSCSACTVSVNEFQSLQTVGSGLMNLSVHPAPALIDRRHVGLQIDRSILLTSSGTGFRAEGRLAMWTGVQFGIDIVATHPTWNRIRIHHTPLSQDTGESRIRSHSRGLMATFHSIEGLYNRRRRRLSLDSSSPVRISGSEPPLKDSSGSHARERVGNAS